MILILSLLVGLLFAAAVYLLLHRSLARVLMGLAMMSYGTNLLIFVAGGLGSGKAPIIGTVAAGEVPADPLPQALILTAIVISFGVLAFALVLFRRVYSVVGSDDLDQMRATDELKP